jgi:hypothetical protein
VKIRKSGPNEATIVVSFVELGYIDQALLMNHYSHAIPQNFHLEVEKVMKGLDSE